MLLVVSVFLHIQRLFSCGSADVSQAVVELTCPPGGDRDQVYKSLPGSGDSANVITVTTKYAKAKLYVDERFYKHERMC